MSRTSNAARCVGSPSFRPEEAIEDTARHQQARDLLAKNDLYEASRVLLGLPERDSYTYHATASVKLAEVQNVVNLGGANGLHAWYRGEDGSPVSASSTCIDQPRRVETEEVCRENPRRSQTLKHTFPSSVPLLPRPRL